MVGKELLAHMLRSAAGALDQSVEQLGRIDSEFGDGDHGVAMGKVARILTQQADSWAASGYASSLQDFLDQVGMAVMGMGGGSSGPLYGTLLSGLGSQLTPDDDDIDGDVARRMFAGSLSQMRDVTKAQVGDKTMMDALIPAAEAAASTQGDATAVFEAAADAAERGAKASEGFVSKFGRARLYGDKTLGTPDAGAVSTAVLIRGLAQGLARDDA